MADPSLRVLRDEVDNDLRGIFVTIMKALSEQKLLQPGLDLEMESEKFYSLIDGLAIHAILRPQHMPPDKIDAVIKSHLDSICKAAAK